jgi:hypothetical protein
MSIAELGLSADEVAKVAEYTVQKIKAYPKKYGITVENYFDVLFQNELRDCAMRREINQVSERSAAYV